MSKPSRAAGGWILGLVMAGIVIVGIGLVRGSSSFASYGELAKSRDLMRETVEGLRQENADLQSEIHRLRRSPSYAKKVLRDKYHVTEPDEDIVFFAD